MEYDPVHMWDGGISFGASLEALAELGAALGYGLVATDSRGVNAFFVRHELCEEGGLAVLSAAEAYHPPRYGPFFGSHMPTSMPAPGRQ